MYRVVPYGSDPITLKSQPRCLEYRLFHPHDFCAPYDPYQQGSSDEIELGHARRPSRRLQGSQKRPLGTTRMNIHTLPYLDGPFNLRDPDRTDSVMRPTYLREAGTRRDDTCTFLWRLYSGTRVTRQDPV
jgi:hypothetical protein